MVDAQHLKCCSLLGVWVRVPLWAHTLPKNFLKLANVDLITAIIAIMDKRAEKTIVYHTLDYIRERRKILNAHLEGDLHDQTSHDKSAVFLKSFDEKKHRMIILSVDIVRSTKLSNTLQPKDYEQLVSAFLFETSEIIPNFQGHILKYLGDGFLSYFFDSSETHLYSNRAIQCAYSLQEIVEHVLNHIFVKKHYPRIHIRTALDSGYAYLTHIGSPRTKRQSDILGKVINITTKLQALAEKNRIVIGEDLYNHLDTSIVSSALPVKLPKTWGYRNAKGQPYAVYTLDPTLRLLDI